MEERFQPRILLNADHLNPSARRRSDSMPVVGYIKLKRKGICFLLRAQWPYSRGEEKYGKSYADSMFGVWIDGVIRVQFGINTNLELTASIVRRRV